MSRDILATQEHLISLFSIRLLVKERKQRDGLPTNAGMLRSSESPPKWVLSERAVTRGTIGHAAVLAG
ncbi:hypothetical protein PHYPO_G00167980 [Pangasianodon hypophthalmus]|uniref:Uncharacterized protein n=1 Tax=Pangasianodon hypophthalmus TaxID=310915 RepID=A0A5N5JLM4_PANHP|nr:hypothetical protein PHYPO_G00167980 [Pangasianodon hypophthalmus]